MNSANIEKETNQKELIGGVARQLWVMGFTEHFVFEFCCVWSSSIHRAPWTCPFWRFLTVHYRIGCIH
ncbi:hypothetical protein LINPERPRIM_LOCUS12057, partial [Linum perenne]